MFKDKKILITGGTGSLGQALTKKLLKLDVNTIRIFSRNESKQVEMESKFNDKKLRYFLGDINDLPRLIKALEDVDFVFHAAALKHVPKIEYNPFEAIKTNVIGSQNVIEACVANKVKKAICISTDKAVSPLNAYGATKRLMEKLFVSANNYGGIKQHKTQFITARYGNVFGSSGSVFPKFIEQIKLNQKITITDPKMTRFSITMDDALDFILNAIKFGKGSEIFVPRLKAYSILTINDALSDVYGKIKQETIGIRPGEKLHETLIDKDEMRYSWEYKNMYLISNPFYSTFYGKKIEKVYNGIKKIKKTDVYSSDKVPTLSKKEIINTLKQSELVK
jgi:UDP-N-acetylglucosamine 4,6-dehydratase/5-epimerase